MDGLVRRPVRGGEPVHPGGRPGPAAPGLVPEGPCDPLRPRRRAGGPGRQGPHRADFRRGGAAVRLGVRSRHRHGCRRDARRGPQARCRAGGVLVGPGRPHGRFRPGAGRRPEAGRGGGHHREPAFPGAAPLRAAGHPVYESLGPGKTPPLGQWLPPRGRT